MKFKQISMHNFMRYKGDNCLDFSCDPLKNVTIVLGNNTYGKTTIAQAFRWGLYGDLNATNYTKKRDIVLLNNEVIAEMSVNDHQTVSVSISVENSGTLYEFRRMCIFRKKNNNPNDLAIIPVSEPMLTMQINRNGTISPIINNDGNNGGKEAKEYPKGCVQDTINSMFPISLSNYFFFDGERWNSLKNKTGDIKDSINTILGVTSLLKMCEHLKNNSSLSKNSVIKFFRSRIEGADGEYEKILDEIKDYEEKAQNSEESSKQYYSNMETAQGEMRQLEIILNDNKKVEDDQKMAKKYQRDIENLKLYEEVYYSDIIKQFSNSAKYFASAYLGEVQKLLESVDLSGKDIPGVTVDTIDYLINEGQCLCGEPLSEDSKAFKNLMKLRAVIPPEMIGGAAGKFEELLIDWNQMGVDILNEIEEKAQMFEDTASSIEEKEEEYIRLIKSIDKKTNMEDVRKRYNTYRSMYSDAEQKYNQADTNMKFYLDKIKKLEEKADEISRKNKKNDLIYRCIAYSERLYEYSLNGAKRMEEPILDELNEIIGENFEKMFNDKEKYAKLGMDYQIHMYYRKVGDFSEYEEENLSNGETIAINFVYIVSILELAKRKKQEAERNNEDDNSILNLPLVLDGPFSNLSNDNTGLIAQKLPEFAEQVIIFMLDKDWEASGLSKYTDTEYCYRVNKEVKSNSSTIEKVGVGL